VLKDGSAAANMVPAPNGGVILVTTKQGKPGPAPLRLFYLCEKGMGDPPPGFYDGGRLPHQDRLGQYPQLNAANDKGASTDFFDGLIKPWQPGAIPQSFTIGRYACHQLPGKPVLFRPAGHSA